jgi:uncharacterized membrane protein
MSPRTSKLAVSTDCALDWRNWRQSEFWRNLFLYFWFFSFIGHVLELFWVGLGRNFSQSIAASPGIPLFAVAAPYGLGAVALMLLVYPLVREKKINMTMAFFLGMLIASAIEFLCAAVIVLIAGHNYFWDYSDEPFNLFGWICLRNSIAFGIASVAALYWLFPVSENLMTKIKNNHLNIVFWVLFVGYLSVQILHAIIRW